jgi:hypothetical protein
MSLAILILRYAPKEVARAEGIMEAQRPETGTMSHVTDSGY